MIKKLKVNSYKRTVKEYIIMRREATLFQKRNKYVRDYMAKRLDEGAMVKEVLIEISEKLFIHERTIFAIIKAKGNYSY